MGAVIFRLQDLEDRKGQERRTNESLTEHGTETIEKGVSLLTIKLRAQPSGTEYRAA